MRKTTAKCRILCSLFFILRDGKFGPWFRLPVQRVAYRSFLSQVGIDNAWWGQEPPTVTGSLSMLPLDRTDNLVTRQIEVGIVEFNAPIASAAVLGSS